MIKPSYFLLGAPKCGTTALASYLSTHPDLVVSNPKETHYFCGAFKTGWRAGSDAEYLHIYFPSLTGGKTGIDASVWYLYAPGSVERILNYNPSAKFLVMLRPPVLMAYSFYNMLNFLGWEDQPTIFDAWKKQPARMAGYDLPANFPHDWDTRILQYKDICSLGSQLIEIFKFIPRDKLLIQWQRDLSRDTRKTYLRTLEYMGLEDDNRMDFPLVNYGKTVSNGFLVRAQRRRDVRKLAIRIKKVLKIKSFKIGRLDLPMPEDVKSFLEDQLSDENRKLETLMQSVG